MRNIFKLLSEIDILLIGIKNRTSTGSITHSDLIDAQTLLTEARSQLLTEEVESEAMDSHYINDLSEKTQINYEKKSINDLAEKILLSLLNSSATLPPYGQDHLIEKSYIIAKTFLQRNEHHDS